MSASSSAHRQFARILDQYTYQFDGLHLRVQRRDGQGDIPWDDLQTVKNWVMGNEAIAIEFYPAESQLVDEINARHLWAVDLDQLRRIGFDGTLHPTGI